MKIKRWFSNPYIGIDNTDDLGSVIDRMVKNNIYSISNIVSDIVFLGEDDKVYVGTLTFGQREASSEYAEMLMKSVGTLSAKDLTTRLELWKRAQAGAGTLEWTLLVSSQDKWSDVPSGQEYKYVVDPGCCIRIKAKTEEPKPICPVCGDAWPRHVCAGRWVCEGCSCTWDETRRCTSISKTKPTELGVDGQQLFCSFKRRCEIALDFVESCSTYLTSVERRQVIDILKGKVNA